MKIKQFEVPGLAQYSYVLSSEGEAIVIDPMRDFDRYTDYAHEQDLVIKYVTETHIHADFASGAFALAEAVGAELALSSYDQEPYRYSMEHHALQDHDLLRVGKLCLAALHTPGHTPEHLSFVLFDEKRDASQPLALFTGDFLFVGSLGRRTCWARRRSRRSLTNCTAACMNASHPCPTACRSTRVTALVRSVVRA